MSCNRCHFFLKVGCHSSENDMPFFEGRHAIFASQHLLARLTERTTALKKTTVEGQRIQPQPHMHIARPRHISSMNCLPDHDTQAVAYRVANIALDDTSTALSTYSPDHLLINSYLHLPAPITKAANPPCPQPPFRKRPSSPSASHSPSSPSAFSPPPNSDDPRPSP